MISEPHLNHWLEEIEYAHTGIVKEVNKPAMRGMTSTRIVTAHESDVLSFEYMREKLEVIQRLVQCIREDMIRDNA